MPCGRDASNPAQPGRHAPLHEKAVAPLFTKLAATKRKTVHPPKLASTVGRALGRIKAHKYSDYVIDAAGQLQWSRRAAVIDEEKTVMAGISCTPINPSESARRKKC